MSFKAKLRKLGNSIGIIVPKKEASKFEIDDILEFEILSVPFESKEHRKEYFASLEAKKEPKEEVVRVVEEKVVEKESNDSTRMEMCTKHPGSRKFTCGCK